MNNSSAYYFSVGSPISFKQKLCLGREKYEFLATTILQNLLTFLVASATDLIIFTEDLCTLFLFYIQIAHNYQIYF